MLPTEAYDSLARSPPSFSDPATITIPARHIHSAVEIALSNVIAYVSRTVIILAAVGFVYLTRRITWRLSNWLLYPQILDVLFAWAMAVLLGVATKVLLLAGMGGKNAAFFASIVDREWFPMVMVLIIVGLTPSLDKWHKWRSDQKAMQAAREAEKYAIPTHTAAIRLGHY